MTESWRDKIKVHPLADLFPMLPPDELRELAEDIKTNLLREVVVFSEDGLLIDGRNRLAAMELAGIPFEMNLHSRTLHYGDVDAYIISKNIHRRHLTKEQKAALIIKVLKASEEFSKLAKSKESSDLAILAKSESRQFPGGVQGGSTKDPIKEKAVAAAARAGVGQRTVERVLAKSNGPAYPSRTIRPNRAPNRSIEDIVDLIMGFIERDLVEKTYEKFDLLCETLTWAIQKRMKTAPRDDDLKRRPGESTEDYSNRLNHDSGRR